MSALIYTVAVNGYQHDWSDCIATQRAYASRIGAQYVSVEKPAKVESAALGAWLKIPILLSALESGWDHVAYIDADCEVSKDAPDFRTLFAPAGKSVLMANGRSGRLNSGVIMARSDEGSRDFLDAVLRSINEVIPAEDRANLKYENGNVIAVAKQRDDVGLLAPEWNNSTDLDARDFIRHYTGPMREIRKKSLVRKIRARIAKLGTQPPTAQPAVRPEGFDATLRELTARCVELYPALTRA